MEGGNRKGSKDAAAGHGGIGDTVGAGASQEKGIAPVIDGGISLDRDSQLQRGLKSRHIQFLALGGA